MYIFVYSRFRLKLGNLFLNVFLEIASVKNSEGLVQIKDKNAATLVSSRHLV